MRLKTVIIILTAVLTVVLGAVAFLIGMLLGNENSDKDTQIAEQGSIPVSDIENHVETVIITTEEVTETTVTQIEQESIVVMETETELTTATTSGIDVDFYRNYYPGITEFVYNGIVSTRKDDLNLRSLPSENSEILAGIPKGTSIPVYRTKESDWYWTSYWTSNQYIHGYVKADYVKIDASSQQFEPGDYTERLDSAEAASSMNQAVQPGQLTYLFGGYVALETAKLNLRKAPNTNAEILDQIPAKTQLDIYAGGTSGWYWTFYNGKGGYISSDYIKEIEPYQPIGDVIPGHEE